MKWINVTSKKTQELKEGTEVLILDKSGRVFLGYYCAYFNRENPVRFKRPMPYTRYGDRTISDPIFWSHLPAPSPTAQRELDAIRQREAEEASIRSEALAEAQKQAAIELNKRQTSFAQSLGYSSIAYLPSDLVYQILSGPFENMFLIWKGWGSWGVLRDEYSDLFTSRELAENALNQFCPTCNRKFGTCDGAIQHMIAKHNEVAA